MNGYFMSIKRVTSEKLDSRLHEIHKGVQKMSFIQSVTLVKQDFASSKSPLERTKLKLVTRVREQIQLAENAAYAPMHKKRIKRDDGTTAVLEVPKRMKRWWYSKADGSVELTVRVGAKKLELAKGKDAIALKSVEDVVPTLNALVYAVQSGEFDLILKGMGSMPERKSR
ncbi:hypothetical protein N9K35_01670 [Pseudomonadales bacterium]|nr:hypothetical protein [Pseudomonadales bacterium]